MTDDLSCWLQLLLVPGIGPRYFSMLIKHFGSPSRVISASENELLSLPKMNDKLVKSIKTSKNEKEIENQIKLIEKYNVNVLTLNDRAYPKRLKEIYDPPPLLFVRGKIKTEDEKAIAIVGSRNATMYGKLITQKFSKELCARGITVISGMARGIDAEAHISAILSKGRTIAVLGCGVDVVYPSEHKSLMEQIIESGAIVSEFLMGSEPARENFPVRNRIISGMSFGVIVVEAGNKSGALITAQYAIEQNREVFAVPGNVNARTSKGTNQLIKQGAKLVENIEDVFDELQFLNQSINTDKSLSKQENLPFPLSDEEKKILESLSYNPIHIDTLLEQCNLPVSNILSILTSLELKGVITQLPGKMFVRL